MNLRSLSTQAAASSTDIGSVTAQGGSKPGNLRCRSRPMRSCIVGSSSLWSRMIRIKLLSKTFNRQPSPRRECIAIAKASPRSGQLRLPGVRASARGRAREAAA